MSLQNTIKKELFNDLDFKKIADEIANDFFTIVKNSKLVEDYSKNSPNDIIKKCNENKDNFNRYYMRDAKLAAATFIIKHVRPIADEPDYIYWSKVLNELL